MYRMVKSLPCATHIYIYIYINSFGKIDLQMGKDTNTSKALNLLTKPKIF